MNIAIITQPLRTNYGGILQNYALHTILKKMGHNPVTLQRDEFKAPEYPRYLLTLVKRLVLKIQGKYKGPLFYEARYQKDYPKFTQHTLGFVERNIQTRVIDYSNPSLREDDFDAYVVGSDQVWRPSYNIIGFTFLDFAKDWNVKRCAYAASFGTDQWEFSSEDTSLCTKLAQKFDAISVREVSGVDLCRKFLAVDAKHVLDPTLLLQREDYERLINEVETKPSEGQLLVHVLDKTQDKDILVEKIAKQHDWKPFSVNCKVDEHELTAPIEDRIQPPIEQWLRAYKDAEFVVTDSFHATVFSIIFNKPFVVYANEGRGKARFLSLLSMFGLEDKLISHSANYNNGVLTKIGYKKVNTKIEQFRAESLGFLRSGLDAL